MKKQSVFESEWRKCQRENLRHAAQSNDTVALPTIKERMKSLGFDDEEINQIYLEATMRSDEVSKDWKPDQSFLPHPMECSCPSCMELPVMPHDDEGQPVSDEA